MEDWKDLTDLAFDGFRSTFSLEIGKRYGTAIPAYSLRNWTMSRAVGAFLVP